MKELVYLDTIKELKETGDKLLFDGGYLAPITINYEFDMPECIHLLSEWRIENPSLSPSVFPVSDTRTSKWIKKAIVDNNKRILFLIQDENYNNIGHIGLSGYDLDTGIIRIDSVIRGVKGVCPGIIGRSIDRIKDLSKNEFDANGMDLLVLSDNNRAIKLYNKCGFEKKSIIPLRKVCDGEEINWIEDTTLGNNAEKAFVLMQCDF